MMDNNRSRGSNGNALPEPASPDASPQRDQRRRSIRCCATAQTQGITEPMNATDQLAWVGAMNCIRSAVEETVLNELICDGTVPKTKKPAGANASVGRRNVEQFVEFGVYK